MRKVIGIIAFVAFLVLLGAVGGISSSTIPLVRGTVIAFSSLYILYLCAKVSGAMID